MNRLLEMSLSLLLQSTLLLSLGLALSALLRRRGPILRAFVLHMTLAGVVLELVLSVSLAGRVQPLWALSLPAATAPHPASFSNPPLPAPGPKPMPPAAAHASPSPVPPPSLAPAPPPARPPHTRFPRTALLWLWLLGTVLGLLWLAVCQGHLTRLARRATALTLGPAAEILSHLAAARGVRPPCLLASPDVRSPFLAGLRRPVIFLPASWNTDYDEETLHVICAHELAHHSRRDLWWTLLLRLTTALLWPQPLLWLLAYQLDQATEEACDLLALSPTLSPHRYADSLLRLADRTLPTQTERTLGAGISPVRSTLGKRIHNVLVRRNQIMTKFSARLRITAMLATAAAAIGGLSLVSASAPTVTASKPIATPLVGTWIVSDPGQKHPTDLVTFQPDGKLTDDVLAEGIIKKGTFTVSGNELNVVMQKFPTQKSPFTVTLHFSIAAGMLTLANEKMKITAVATPATSLQVLALLKTLHPIPSTNTLEGARFMAGLTPVQGPGIVVTLQPTAISPGMYADTNLNGVVAALKDAGAEAIAVNKIRLMFSSTIMSHGADVYINDTQISAPYVVKAIGDPSLLQSALDDQSVDQKGLHPALTVITRPLVMLPASTAPVDDKYAIPLD